MKRLLALAVLFTLASALLYSQGEINDQARVYYRNERTFSFMLNSDGFGAGYREGKWIDPRKKTLYEIDINLLKHPKEVKLTNPWYQTSGTFVFGKLNSVFTLRGGIGLQRELYPKRDLGGIAINYFFGGGATMAIYKPIYYKVLYPVPGSVYFEIKEEKFEVSIHHPSDIYSKASFTKGLDETKVLPGAYAKGGFSFEYSRNDKLVHAIELGSAVSIYPKRVPIMASEDNKALFLSLFVSYRVGLIIDPLNPSSSSIRTIFIRKNN